MDLTILIGIATALLVVLISLFYFQKKNEKSKQQEHQQQQQQQRAVPIRGQDAMARRAQIARNQRNRLRQPAVGDNAAAINNNGENVEDDAEAIPQGQVLDEKMGAKKRAKLEAKEQKRLQREHELHQREERKAKEAKLEEERKIQEEHEAEVERKAAEAERLAKEERERKEYEEYLKMKAAFSVEEEGFEEDETEKDNLLYDFVNYIKDNKVVVLEDLATEFKMKTQQVIDRIQDLQANNTLTGVIDDRGKFIFISEKELASVAKFIRQRGRVSIAEFAENSNKLISLAPISSSSS